MGVKNVVFFFLLFLLSVNSVTSCVCVWNAFSLSYVVLLSVASLGSGSHVPLCPCCLCCHSCMYWLCMLAMMIIPIAFIYLKWCDPGLSAFVLTCCLLFLLFLFCFLFFANKVELTKADLQGREGCSSPLLVWTERCFYVTFGAFYWMQSHLWDKNRITNPSPSGGDIWVEEEHGKQWRCFCWPGGFDCINP